MDGELAGGTERFQGILPPTPLEDIHFLSWGHQEGKAMSAKIANLQGLRGLAVLLVLFLHWQLLEQAYRPDGILPQWLRIGHAGVDLFFVISGFIMVVIARNSPPGMRTAGTFLYHRWARIYPTYWFWFLVSLALYLTVPAWLRLVPRQMPHLIESFFLLPTWSAQLVPVSWTLKYELYFYLVFSALLLFPGRWRIYLLLAWGGSLLIGQSLCYDAPTISCNKSLFLTVHPLAFEFLCGALIGWSYVRWRAPFSLALTCSGASLVVLGLTLYLWSGLDLDDNIWYRVLLFGLPATLFLYGCVELERQRKITAPRWLIGLGDASYSLYLSHFLMMSLFFARFPLYVTLPVWLLDLIVLALALGVGLLGHRWIERPVLRLCRGQYRPFRSVLPSDHSPE